MRKRKRENGVSVHAISGTHVVMLGIDMTMEDCADLLGFAIHREDPTEDEAYWLQGMRTFEATYPDPPRGALVSTYEHPIQDFLWSDFTAKPGRRYRYLVVPVRGKPKNLVYGTGVRIDVDTEPEDGGPHSIWFNRAVIGSQAYSRKFVERPDQLTGAKRDEAYRWLSRGLEEAMVAFIRKAKSTRYALRAAVYEFDYEPVIAEFASAQQRCKDVRLVYDARIDVDKHGVQKRAMLRRVGAVEATLAAHGLDELAIPRTEDPSAISHNKFIVLLEDDRPIEVWTGSTNFTESGIFGQANVGHVVRDEATAAAYLKCFERLAARPEPDLPATRKGNAEATPTLVGYPPPKGVTPLFSPRAGLAQLRWYAAAMDHAESLVCFTGAFGVNKLLLDVFAKDADHLRYLFLEKWGTTAKSAAAAQAALGRDRDNQVAVGSFLAQDTLYHWLRELPNSLSKMIKYVHTKFMLIDPLGTDPVVITGSANFSDASTSSNDENMLVIRGDERVADIYLGEFMRLWRHHRFRFIVETVDEERGEVRPNYLDPTSKWARPFFVGRSIKEKRRLAFG